MGLPLNIESPFEIHLSFFEVIEKLEKVASDPNNVKAAEAKELLAEIALHPELRDGINTIEEIEQNAELIRRMLADYFPAELSENEIKAVGLPYRKVVFNFSERFKRILDAAGPDFDIGIRDFDEHQSYVLSCCIILNEHYGTRLDFNKPMFYDIPTANGTIKHYRILYNADFLHITPTERSVKLTQEDIDLLLDNYDDLELWKAKFPKESWMLRGFSLMNLYDATVENAVSLLKEKLLSSDLANFKESMESIFRSIYSLPDLRVGFMLYNKEANIFSNTNLDNPLKSYILKEGDIGLDNTICMEFYNDTVQERNYFAIADVERFAGENNSGLGLHLLAEDIRSIILAPVIKNGILLGVLELVSSTAKALNSVNAHKLEMVMPFLTDTVERGVSEFQNQVQAIIQNYYTTIHTSVYWRFREEAQKLIHARRQGESYALKEVIFNDVYPLYGQIDIKGSSEARNSSIQHDLKNQLSALLVTLYQAEKFCGKAAFEGERKMVEAFMNELKSPILASTEQHITDYLSSVVHYKLLQQTCSDLRPALDSYFAETNKKSGDFYIHRRKYETTVSLINDKLTRYLDVKEAEAQLIFPHYYERFKTDGVEHNMYIGASISPDRGFNLTHLHQLRLWQLTALCEMERAYNEIKPRLPFQFEVTTLILAYYTAISIRFRMDEKRFDIDGTYNARFEIVKKRIDKAHIKNSTERITEAGKVTIVYSSDTEEQEYRGYIAKLQEQHLLGDEIENFELEDLQGVAGLRALRVKITH